MTYPFWQAIRLPKFWCAEQNELQGLHHTYLELLWPLSSYYLLELPLCPQPSLLSIDNCWAPSPVLVSLHFHFSTQGWTVQARLQEMQWSENHTGTQTPYPKYLPALCLQSTPSPVPACLLLLIQMFPSLLRSHFWDVMQHSPKEMAAHNRTTFFFLFAFVVCLHSVEQTNHTITKCKWPTISCEKACSANNEGFLAFDSRRMHFTKNGLWSQATIMTDKKNVNDSHKYKWLADFMKAMLFRCEQPLGEALHDIPKMAVKETKCSLAIKWFCICHLQKSYGSQLSQVLVAYIHWSSPLLLGSKSLCSNLYPPETWHPPPEPHWRCIVLVIETVP